MKGLNRRLYPIGIQTFSEIREGNYVYADKTDLVYRLTHSDSKYIFLSRPRRFGKSLLTSTLRSYFEGRKELFEGLAIEKLEKEWTIHPVLHFDMSLGKHLDREGLNRYLLFQLADMERTYGLNMDSEDANLRLTNLIRCAYEQTGQKVVVLIDEYDAPLLDVMHEDRDLPVLRNVMRNFYSPLKACDPYLRFVFLTGITKFSQLSIFSELNNILNISMFPEYATLCGITEEEMREQMGEGIDRLAVNLGVTPEEALKSLKKNYDGYHFAWPSPDIYNPFSLLNALANGRIDSYWFGSGTPTYLIEMLRKFHVIPQEIGNRECVAADFDAPTERMTSITPLLYQSGYITIKGYSHFSDLYQLDIPNREVRIGLMRSLLPNYVQRPAELNTLVAKMAEKIYNGDMEGALRLMRTVLSTIPYCENTHYEGHYQQLLYVIFTLLGNYVDVEVRTPKGRVDMVLRTPSTLYVIELKLDQSAEAAMEQIDLKEYPERFVLCALPVVKVGINFSTEKRTIEGWKIEDGCIKIQ
ncbi:ATP-binding protein [Parabacteroides sp. ZJ-118]|uniref:ATP-binding protein n=1 Tax=Parabacteroides sp. ZJ-118 TaxID=2709398 RepID=UPI0013EC3DFC|nr:ATP-binding protein [Parabacteroides sp. ZJ-118]